ncbi:MAG TPA: serine/threonine-protein kinase, partial [Polyangiales bacterium]|nr:serine/threonine-protein kinase [Polyangiales bacterium]
MSSIAPRAWLGRYEPVRALGQGSFGSVYEALDRNTGERVALKELVQVNPTSLTQFKQEFRAAQQVQHPNLVRLDALFEEDGKWLIAMELVEGVDLLTHLYASDNDYGFDEPQLRAVFLQLAQGLGALHAAGLLHRDLKPHNVRVTADGRVVLLDLGLALALDPKAQATQTNAFGSLDYMAPEQAGRRKLGPATDWYAFGVCLFQAMTGLLPVEAASPAALVLAKQNPPPLPAAELLSFVPPDLYRLCVDLLAVEPEKRPSARAIRRVLTRNAIDATSLPPSRPANQIAGGFEGREHELSILSRAVETVRSSRSQIVFVEGDSGIGKSALVEHSLELLQQSVPPPLLLRSRCYENELVAYKAFDGAIDELARALAAMTPTECEALLPPQAALACRLFPALAAVERLAKMPLRPIAADPAAQR